MRTDILTASGRYFDLLMPERNEIEIQDIAHALAHLCRFTGHVREFYSVAQHSVHVSEIVPGGDQLAGLLHDAAEAFLGDVATPLKRQLPRYKEIEERVERVLFERFGLAWPMPDTVRMADRILLATEKRDLMPDKHMDGVVDPATPMVALESKITPWPPERARYEFLLQFKLLTGGAP